ncbi:GspH/FimT family pseudopilin [Luteimonas abyssi]|uniref:GspH/FimT family pseudopilin n=1 Tax=Luteimonas abyssi TaxID=1247514 RepID=UPI000737BC93|nr:GspH/FimT family pseudopilin [Luteimonas abyssi]
MGERGFTLVELMVTIAILAIVIAIAFPNFEGTMRSNRVATTTNELIASLSLARVEALRSPGGAGICASADGTACSGTWNDGWLVWIDGDGDGTLGGENDQVLRVVDARRKMEVEATTGAGAGTATTLAFDQRGRAVVPRTFHVQPDVCPDGQELRRKLTVNATGQVTVERELCE